MQSQSSQTQTESTPQWWQSDDAWAMIMAASVLAITWFALLPVLLPATGETSFENLLSPWVAKPGSWTTNPLAALKGSTQEAGPPRGLAILVTAVGCIVVFVLGSHKYLKVVLDEFRHYMFLECREIRKNACLLEKYL